MSKLKNSLENSIQKWKQTNVYDKFILVISFTYFFAVSAYMVWHQQFFSPDKFFVFGFLGMLLVGKAWSFFWDWLPPILLILGYDYLRGLVPRFVSRVHIRAMIYFDRTIFGQVPTLFLQKHYYTEGVIKWYDNAAVILYFLHFIIPLLVAMLFWLVDKAYFKKYMSAMVILSFAAFFTYILFPAMPPWMAAEQGFLPPVAHIMQTVLANFAHPISLPSFYQVVGANLVAAVPSLHAAYPLMAAIFLYKKFPKYGWLAFLYPACMWLTVVYLGEHYVFDVLMGITYVLLTYALVNKWKGRSVFKKEPALSLALEKVKAD